MYCDQFELVLRRKAGHPGDAWQAEHTELDAQVVDEPGRAVGPWLTVILDDHPPGRTGPHAAFVN